MKKPLNGYQRFVKEQWAKIDDPVAKNRMQILSKRWKEMTQEERNLQGRRLLAQQYGKEAAGHGI